MSAIDADYDRLRKQVEAQLAGKKEQSLSTEYQQFRKQYIPKKFTFYEQACATAASLGLKPSPEEEKRYLEAIETCHLNITPTGANSLALLTSVLVLFLGAFFAMLPKLFNPGAGFSFFFFLLFAVLAASIYVPIKNLPFTFADQWRTRASNQMVLSMFYITTYMRHTSNLENAIDFAADHIGPPLSLDLKKIIWNVQTEKYSSVSESLDHYLIQWRQTNLEFVQSMNLVQASLYESSQERRLGSLEKAMDLMLDETYEKMLHYAQNLKSPMTMLHMLGVILPILGLVILPLAVSFIAEVQWYHIAVLYNVLLPIGVFYLGVSILSKRPNGYGNVDITDVNPELKKFKNHIIRIGNQEIEISPAAEAWILAGILLFIGFIPLMLHALNPDFDMTIGPFKLLEYMIVPSTKELGGPYGLGASVLSLCVTLAAGFGLAHYYNVRSQKIITIRNEAKALEQEFAGAIFQLGNRLGDGLPAEIAFGKVADVMEGTKSGEFFRTVAINIEKMGMSVEQAIFDKKRGAILLYPSPIIESSMKVLIESSKKGPLEASRSLVTMSNYIKEMHRVEERLKDLMADIISSMKSQISFLTPAIAGIVIGITSMITTILGSLQTQMSQFSASGQEGLGGAGLGTLLGLGIPTYFFQIIVGLYVVQITWILAYLVNGIENGEDAVNQEYEQGRGLRIAIALYTGIALVVMLIFNFIATSIMASGIASG